MSGIPKSERTAKRIALTARELFLSQGFTNTTIAQVAEGSGVASGTVMLHFGSKSDLATVVVTNEISKLVGKGMAVARDRGTGNIADDLAAFIRPIFTWYRKHIDVVPDLYREAMFSDGRWAEDYTATVIQTAQVFSEIAGPHVADNVDPDLVGEGLLADYLMTLLRGFRGHFPTVTAQVEHFVALALTRFAAEQ